MGSHLDGCVPVCGWFAVVAFSRSVFGWLLLHAFCLGFVCARDGVEHRPMDTLECEVSGKHYVDGPGDLWNKRAVKMEKKKFSLRPAR